MNKKKKQRKNVQVSITCIRTQKHLLETYTWVHNVKHIYTTDTCDTQTHMMWNTHIHATDTYKFKTEEKAITRETVFVEVVTVTVAVVSVVVTVVG